MASINLPGETGLDVESHRGNEAVLTEHRPVVPNSNTRFGSQRI